MLRLWPTFTSAESARCDCGPPSRSHLGRPAPSQSLRLAAQRGGQGRSRRTGGTWTCSARCDRDAPGAAHTWSAWLRVAAAPCPPWRSGSAASHERNMHVLATNRFQLTLRPPGADSPPGQSHCSAWHERHEDVLCSLRSLRNELRPTRGPCGADLKLRAGAAVSHERHVDVLSSIR